MNFTIEHLQTLINRLPPGYLLEPIALPPSSSLGPSPAGSYPTSSEVTEGYSTLFTILAKLKVYRGYSHFQGSEGEGVARHEINLAVFERRLYREEYENGLQFAADIRQMCTEKLRKCTENSEAASVILSFRGYFEEIMRGKETILLIIRKKQRIIDTEKPTNSGFSTDRLHFLIAKIRLLETKHVQRLAEMLESTDISDFLGNLEVRIRELHAVAFLGVEKYVKRCLSKGKCTLKAVGEEQDWV